MAESGPGTDPAVIAHWRTRIPDFDTVLARLREDGIDTAALTVEALNKVDLMHVGGEEATDALADLAAISADTDVLDAGCGLGGASRRIAHLRAARVTGLDLTPGAAETANALNELLGLSDRVHVKQGSVIDMPFGDRSFDVVLVQHCAMQVADKDRLFSECRRVLRPGGTLAMHDWFEGAVKPVNYPLPWADTPEISFLESVDATARRLAARGFTSEPFVDQTVTAINTLEESRRRIDERRPPGKTLTESQQRTLSVVSSLVSNLTGARLRVGFLIARRGDPFDRPIGPE